MRTLSIILIILTVVVAVICLSLLWYGISEARKGNEHRRQMERAGLPYSTPKRRGVPPKNAASSTPEFEKPQDPAYGIRLPKAGE